VLLEELRPRSLGLEVSIAIDRARPSPAAVSSRHRGVERMVEAAERWYRGLLSGNVVETVPVASVDSLQLCEGVGLLLSWRVAD